MKNTILNSLYAILFNNRGNVGFMDGAGDAGSGGDDGEGDSGAGAANSGDGDAGSGDAGNTSDNGQESKISYPDNLDKDLHGNKMFEPFISAEGKIDYGNLMKSYAHSQKLIGGDKMVVPTQDFGDDQWRETFHKLGLPKDAKEYEIKNNVPEGMDANEDFLNHFKDTAYKAGVLPRQAQAMLDSLNEHIGTASKAQNDQFNSEYSTQVEALKNDWGEGFPKKVAQADAALKHFADDKTVEALQKAGVLNDVNLTKLFAKIGEGLKEDTNFNDEVKRHYGMSPEDAKVELQKFYDPNTKYGIAFKTKDHPDHQWALKEFMKVQESIHGKKESGKTFSYGS